MMSGNYTSIDNQNLAGYVPAISDFGHVPVNIAETSGKIASGARPPRDATDTFSKPASGSDGPQSCGVNFVKWKEKFVSQERGSCIVHYILKDFGGKSVLAVVGTERSLRHMVYIVAEEFLSYSSTDNSVQAGFKWRSRREVVDWLTSMLAKQQQADSPSGDSTHSLGSSELLSAHYFSADKMKLEAILLRYCVVRCCLDMWKAAEKLPSILQEWHYHCSSIFCVCDG